MTFSLTNSFHFAESIPKDDASSSIRRDINEYLEERGHSIELRSNKADDRFEVEFDTSRGELELEIGLDVSPGSSAVGGPPGQNTKVQSLEVTAVRATAEIRGVNYRQYRGALETCDEYIDAIGFSLSQEGYSSTKGVYSVTCKLGSPPAFARLMAPLEVEQITAHAGDTEVEIKDNKFLVRNVDQSEFAVVLDTLRDLIAFYG